MGSRRPGWRARRARPRLPSRQPLAARAAAHAADHIVLAVDPPEDHERYSPMVSRLLQLAVFDILTTAVALRLPAAVRALPQGIKNHLRSRREPA